MENTQGYKNNAGKSLKKHRLTRHTKGSTVLFLFLPLLFSCQKKRNHETLPPSIQQVVHVEKAIGNNTSDFSDLIDTNWIIALKTPKEDLQGTITKVETSPDFIFTLDELQTKSLNVYDKRGNFVRKIGKLGRGPQELMNISDFCIFQDQIFLVDNILKKIQIFDLRTGDFVKSGELDFRPHELHIYHENCYFFELSEYNDESEPEFQTHHIVITDSLYRAQKFLLPRPKASSSVTPYTSIFNPILFRGQDIFYFSPRYDFIYQYSADSLYPVIALDFGPGYEIPYSKRDDDELFTSYAKSHDYAYLTESPIILEDYLAGIVRVNNTKRFILCRQEQEYSQEINLDHYNALDPIFPIGKDKDNTLISIIDIVGIEQLKAQNKFQEVIARQEDSNFLLFTKLKSPTQSVKPQ